MDYFSRFPPLAPVEEPPMTNTSNGVKQSPIWGPVPFQLACTVLALILVATPFNINSPCCSEDISPTDIGPELGLLLEQCMQSLWCSLEEKLTATDCPMIHPVVDTGFPFLVDTWC